MQRQFTVILIGWIMGSGGVGTAAGAASKGVPAVDYEREVRPVLSQHCFKCHGMDEQARKAKLRLDSREAALAPLKSGARAIVPGQPDQSELIRRIFSTDEDEVMPPPAAKLPLTPEQKQILKQWVSAGAEYREHWAFVAPRQVPVPQVKRTKWPRNAIDHFVLARLEEERLKPSPEADRYTLVRRLYLDLIGLPPTPDEVTAFVQDKSSQAYEKLVDQLLASPHYGERWARRWLDLARYADTNGYEKDRPRSIWPYRDWVIQALNADMPFDQFTIEQIAGDLLPNATLAQRIATGFHRNTMLNEEGGIDPLEFRFYALTDRVATTGKTWLGLTLQCAQCHTHKYDPIPQREYYQLMAFLDNADEPQIELPDPEVEARRKVVQSETARLVAELANKFPAGTNGQPRLTGRENLEAKFSAWLERERHRSVEWITLPPTAAQSNLPLLTVQADGSVFASGDTTKSDTYELKFTSIPAGVTAVRLEALPDDRLPAHGPGMTYYEGPLGDFFLGEFQLTADGDPVRFSQATESYAKNNFGKTPATAALAIDGDPQTGWSCAGRYGERHEAVFNLAEPLKSARELQLKMLMGRHYPASLGRFRISVTTDPQGAEARDLPEDVVRLLRLPDEELTGVQRERLRKQFLLLTPELAEVRAEIDKRRSQMPAYPTTLVLTERPRNNSRQTFIHRRGEFLQPTDRVEPGVLSVLNPLPPNAPRNRLEFARWLVARDNPLTARVVINRQWAAFFGRGIVRTVDDFGFQGSPPTHPQLLDWLAVEFMDQGWSFKRMHKLIVMSATYRQSSHVTPQLLAKDAENALLARGPRVRLEAELVRDSALRIAGLLSEKMGGPSVFPPQPANVTTEGAYGKLEWKVSEGEDRYRRGLYTFSKRTAPYAMFTTFDAPSGEECVARREASNSPLQALTMLNDAVLIEASQALGRLMADQPGTEAARVRWLFQRFFTRPPARDEVGLLVKFLQTQKRRFASGELDATAVAGHGDGEADERAAWTALARALFNLDEAITKG